MEDFVGIDGFLGTRASLMLDVLFLTMFAVVLVLAWSVYQVKYVHRYQLHKRVQCVLAAILLVVVLLFEIDTRIHGWEDRAAGVAGGSASSAAWTALTIHLAFAISAVILWPLVLFRALRSFPNPATPSRHSPWHIRWARIAAIDMILTAITGWVFYWLAFVV
jgi:uncharacterized membrane protein YozB (DUF420 family)